MSRTLARLRAATGDPLLVQAGRSLVATPHAEELSGRIHTLVQDAQFVLRPAAPRLDLSTLERTFTVRTNEGFLSVFSAPLVAAITEAAPRVRLCFVPKPDKDALPLREGRIDLEIGTTGVSAPEVRTRLIFRDNFVGAARIGHPLLAGPITPERYAESKHVVASRRGALVGPVDECLRELGLERQIVVVVPGFPDALRIARQSDLVALVPRSCLISGDPFADGLSAFDLPVAVPEITISAMWHPRFDADPAHQWLRETIVMTCRAAAPAK